MKLNNNMGTARDQKDKLEYKHEKEHGKENSNLLILQRTQAQ